MSDLPDWCERVELSPERHEHTSNHYSKGGVYIVPAWRTHSIVRWVPNDGKTYGLWKVDFILATTDTYYWHYAMTLVRIGKSDDTQGSNITYLTAHVVWDGVVILPAKHTVIPFKYPESPVIQIGNFSHRPQPYYYVMHFTVY